MEIVGIHEWIQSRLGKPPKTGRKVGRDSAGVSGKSRGTRIHAELLRRIRKDAPPITGWHPWTERIYKYLKRNKFTLDPSPPPLVTDSELGFHTKVDLVIYTPEGRKVLVELKTSTHEPRKKKLPLMKSPFRRWFANDTVENRAILQVLMPVLALRELRNEAVFGLVIFVRPVSIQATILNNAFYTMGIRQALLHQ